MQNLSPWVKISHRNTGKSTPISVPWIKTLIKIPSITPSSFYKIAKIIKHNPEFLFPSIRWGAINTRKPPWKSWLKSLTESEYKTWFNRSNFKQVGFPANWHTTCCTFCWWEYQSLYVPPPNDRKHGFINLLIFGFLNHHYISFIFFKDFFDGEVFPRPAQTFNIPGYNLHLGTCFQKFCSSYTLFL